MSRDVNFDESASWYLPSTPTPNSNLITKDEVNEPETNREEEEARNFGSLGETLISFRLNGLNEQMSRNDQSDEESASSRDSIVHSPR